MKQVPLTNSDKVAIVDDADFEMISQKKWFLTTWGYASSTTAKPFQGYMHQFVLGRTKIDHRNGDKLDNRRENLRLCTHQQNNQNKGPQRNNTSGFKGVSRSGNSLINPWSVRIQRADRYYEYLGRFPTKEDAARAYDAAAIKHHGEFAYTNFPREEYGE